MKQKHLPENELDYVISLYSDGKLYEAIEKIEALSEVYPNVPILLNILGVCYKQLGDLEEANRIFQFAISIKPDYADAYYNLGIVLSESGKLNLAIESYNKAIELFPEYVDAYNNLGNTYKDLDRKDEAINSFEMVIKLNPEYAEAYYNLGNTYKEIGNFTAAQDYYEKALELKPDYAIPQHMINSLTGHTSKSPPKEYVKNLFDDYAERFNDSLVQGLQYKLPFIIKDLIQNISSKSKFAKTIDLGCGTGLSGNGLSEISEHLSGIDISENMISKADELDIYDNLYTGDIVEVLNAVQENFDLFVALDVLIYVGDVESIFNTVHKYSNPESIFVFSTEIQEESGYSLLKSGRYSHSDQYIMKQASNRFNFFASKNVNLRKENGNSIKGRIYFFKAF